jgi:hypothetical protein
MQYIVLGRLHWPVRSAGSLGSHWSAPRPVGAANDSGIDRDSKGTSGDRYRILVQG